MTRTKIKFNLIYNLTKRFFKTIEKQTATIRARGRPPKYEDAMILSIAVIIQLYSFSIREALEYVRGWHKEVSVPSNYQ